MKSIILNASFVFFVCAGAISHAQPATAAAPQITVPYSDLDLNREPGAGVMLTRLHMAAGHVCGGRPDARRIDQTASFQACTRHAMDDAVAQLGSHMVSRLYGNSESRVAFNQ